MQTIDLQTTQNVTIEYQLASLGERFMALVIDLITIVTSYWILVLLIVTILGENWADYTMSLFGAGTLAIFFLLYHFLFEFLGNGQSLGKKALSIQVVRLDSEELSAGDSMLRAILYFVDLFASFGVLGAFTISSTPNKQRLGDMAAGTVLIKVRIVNRFALDDILNISSLADYEPKYLTVRQFSEHDMLLIKSTLARYQRYPNPAHRKLVQNLAQKLSFQLGESTSVTHPKEFLKTLIRDYIVLTR